MCGVPSYWLDNGLEYRIDQLHKALVAMPPGLTLEEISADDYNRGYTLEAAGRISRIIKFEEGAETSIYDQESQTWKFENWVSYV